MAQLYPPLHPYVTHSLAMDELHTLHVEECGSPRGIPVLFVHGGPGAGTSPVHRRFFDPDRYRIILFDQRGCGRSTPHAELRDNTTEHLLEDMQRIRQHLGIERWMLFGGSWGSTLSLAYAQRWPERVTALVLRGIFLCRPRDLRWFYQRGASEILPDHWQDFLAPIPTDQRDDLLHPYHRLLTGDNEVARMAAAKAWCLWEARAATLRPEPLLEQHMGDPFNALAMARIESHFFVHDAFLEPDQLLRDAHRLADIPGVIVHGRYDLICPLENAWSLHRAWSKAEYIVTPEAGHAATEPQNLEALVAACDRLARQLRRP